MIEKKLSNDSEMWEAFKKGDESAYELMFRENYPILINYGLKFNNEEDEVKDCVQQLFAKLWESRERLGANNNIRGYLLASVRRMILRESKRKPLMVEISGLNHKFLLDVSVENQYLKGVIKQEDAARVVQLLNLLPHRQKEALYLRFYGDQSFAEIATVMGITTRAVYKLVYKATARLAVELKQQQETEKYKLSLVAS
ncbi:sigma-70 family RNA polymerase sigma factor [Gilvimarinus agarilyticus]|uniref:RNA polymerase sigma factor, sigma-70 family n=1 Tax=Reichenbachiella agariperforans TaxID=156994 RepID=A0A1M6KET2_REIAG|nr:MULTISPECIES: sigma-70 family RNA polymerase sigma factor [Reichenbachiella]MBU2886066.1 sigma-70 family RNA polymerase sigma factor [Gilvimarinus agarilyticus]MBU2913530.1 sigma-70 family RNA polymerase sigma factor [Reichenbachiella agariperforans]RJE74505.1 hypothetical protein BGP76_15255 [Reichenbachiella sp. MSK19-1]SHJ57454.1 RNA polymerase sigma factor, sigma-70 family [Reichenbachiella agariperforans]